MILTYMHHGIWGISIATYWTCFSDVIVGHFWSFDIRFSSFFRSPWFQLDFGFAVRCIWFVFNHFNFHSFVILNFRTWIAIRLPNGGCCPMAKYQIRLNNESCLTWIVTKSYFLYCFWYANFISYPFENCLTNRSRSGWLVRISLKTSKGESPSPLPSYPGCSDFDPFVILQSV